MAVDGKLSVGMPLTVLTVHCSVYYPGTGDYLGKGSGQRQQVFVLCPAQHKKRTWEGLPKEGGYSGEVVSGCSSGERFTKCEVSSFSIPKI